jgi:folylpolyglutamate synthase/dihydropteroate synthase
VESASPSETCRCFDDVITLAGRHEVPATKFELLTAVALKILHDTRVAWAGASGNA